MSLDRIHSDTVLLALLYCCYALLAYALSRPNITRLPPLPWYVQLVRDRVKSVDAAKKADAEVRAFIKKANAKKKK